ncbi:MAG: hypothetical protein LBL48_03880 [Azoarcus sp.]|jgi:hypothetical protein|nr:hypothetical protein [Azoarcus sp.]
MKLHKIGATIDWAGPVRIKGTFPDLGGWSASAVLRGRGFRTPIPCELLHADGVTVLRLRLAPSAQARWKSCEAALELRFTSPTGAVFITPSTLLRLVSAE